MANPKLPPALKYFREGFRPLTVAPTAGRPIRRMLPWSTCGHTQGLVRIAPAKQYRMQLHVTTNVKLSRSRRRPSDDEAKEQRISYHGRKPRGRRLSAPAKS